MRTIQLTKGKSVMVDDEDYEFLMQWKWHLVKEQYASRMGRWNEGGNKVRILMHRVIMNCPADKVVDHMDRNGLNCQKSNMRVCDVSQNNANTRSKSKTGYKGVHASRNKFSAQITINGKTTHLGVFETVEQAAICYDQKAKELHGEFAFLNFPS